MNLTRNFNTRVAIVEDGVCVACYALWVRGDASEFVGLCVADLVAIGFVLSKS